MSTRIFNGFAALSAAAFLSGCGLLDSRNTSQASGAGSAGPNVTSLAEAEKAAEAEQIDDGKIACAVDGASELSRSCLLEQTQTDTGLVLTVKHPDGGFRKLKVVKDGRGVIAADGADVAKVSIAGARQIEVKLAGDRYLLPASQGSAANAANAAQPAPARPVATKPSATKS